MLFEEFLSRFAARTDWIDKTLLGLVTLGLVAALVAAVVPTRERTQHKDSQHNSDE
jgi:uncharacterized membrane protein YesL